LVCQSATRTWSAAGPIPSCTARRACSRCLRRGSRRPQDLCYYADDLRRRADLPPQADLIASFIEVEAAGRLSHEELLGYLYLLSIAGNETTTKLIGNVVCQLHLHPDQRLGPDDRALRRWSSRRPCVSTDRRR
jgi:cytochrome P450